MSRRIEPIVIEVSNPSAFSGRGSVIVLELADEAAAERLAQKIARETGRSVTVRGADLAEIKTISASKSH